MERRFYKAKFYSLTLCEAKNEIWSYEIPTEKAGISSLKVAKLGKIL
jgi:hypothetical protein